MQYLIILCNHYGWFEGVLMTFLTLVQVNTPRMLNIKDSNYKLSKNLFNGIGFIWIIMMGLFALYGLLKIDKEILFLLFVLIFIYLILAISDLVLTPDLEYLLCR